MAHRFNVWIVEDDLVTPAARAVETVAGEHSAKYRLFWNKDFEWSGDYPQFIDLEEKPIRAQLSSQLPDIVILDLCVRREQKEELAAKPFYHRLRAFERRRGRPANRAAPVILWSGLEGLPDVRSFVAELLKPDSMGRVTNTETKSALRLEQALRGYWTMLEQERLQDRLEKGSAEEPERDMEESE